MIRKIKRRAERNKKVKQQVEDIVKKIRRMKVEDLTKEDISKLYKILDKAAKRHVIHHNKAARLKSRLTKKK